MLWKKMYVPNLSSWVSCSVRCAPCPTLERVIEMKGVNITMNDVFKTVR